MRHLNRHPGSISLAFFIGSFGAFSLAIVNRRSDNIAQQVLTYLAAGALLGMSITYFRRWLFAGNRYVLIPANIAIFPVPVISTANLNP